VTAVYAIAHFAVDLGCAFAVFSGGSSALGFLLYNFFAFAVQMPLGLLADRFGKSRWFAITGACLVFLICCLRELSLLAVCLLGLGNALFHVGGGVAILDHAGDRAAELGVFVSPGAMGIYLGSMLTHRWVVLLVLGVCVGWMLAVKEKSVHSVMELPEKGVIPWAGLLFLVVVLRSYGGMAGSFSWKTGGWGLAAVMAVVLGKTCGGILSDRFGAIRVSVCSLGLAAALYGVGELPVCGVLAMFLFNMTMPITLFALAKAMPGCRGFAFGLLTFALFLGFLPTYLGAGSIGSFGMAVVAVSSLVLLVPGLGKLKNCVSRQPPPLRGAP